jgi:hypothetical protein
VGSSVLAVLGFALLFALDASAGRGVAPLIDASPAGMGWIHAAALLAGATAFLLSGCSRGEARA